MTSRRVMLAGKPFVINLNNRGGVRKAPSRSPRGACLRQLVGNKRFSLDDLTNPACTGKGKFGGKTTK